jgi:hypothetical protein
VVSPSIALSTNVRATRANQAIDSQPELHDYLEALKALNQTSVDDGGSLDAHFNKLAQEFNQPGGRSKLDPALVDRAWRVGRDIGLSQDLLDRLIPATAPSSMLVLKAKLAATLAGMGSALQAWMVTTIAVAVPT